MSTTVTKSLTINYNNVQSYATAGGDAKIHTTQLGINNQICIPYLSYGTNGYAELNSAAMNILYPNSAAKPYKCDYRYMHGHLAANNPRTALSFDNTEIVYCTSSENIYVVEGSSTAAVVKNSTKNSKIRFHMSQSKKGLAYIGIGAGDEYELITLYFTRYDFSAVADGVTSASVSSSTGYDGDSITFSCVIPTGYVFDGWYSGSTLVSSSQSYTHTVNGADKTLTAKAHQNTHSVNGTYNGSTKAVLSDFTEEAVVEYNGQTATLNSSNPTLTLACAGKVMRGNIVIKGYYISGGLRRFRSRTFSTAEKIMKSDLVLNYV